MSPAALSHQPRIPDAMTVSPANVELVQFNRQLRGRAVKTFLLIAVMLVTWSYLTEIDDIAGASGQLIPAQEVQSMRAAFDGKIAAVNVQEGQKVAKGTLLITLNRDKFAAELQKYEHELSIAQRDYDRHVHAEKVIGDYLKRPEVLPTDLSGVSDVAQSIGNCYAAYQKLVLARSDMQIAANSGNGVSTIRALSFQRSHLDEERKLKEQSLADRLRQFSIAHNKLADKIVSLQQQLELQKLAVKQKSESLDIVKQQLQDYQTAAETGASSQAECLNARMRVEEAERELTQAQTVFRSNLGELSAAQHQLNQQKHANAVSQLQLDANIKDLSASAAQIPIKMRDAQRELLEARHLYQVALRNAQSEHVGEQAEISLHQKQVSALKAMIQSQRYLLERCELRSPLDGVVALMQVQGPGQVVQQGQTLLTIVPTDEDLLVQSYVANSDIGFVKNGQPVRLEFPAYPYQQYGTITGKVIQINDAPANDKEHSDSYRILVKLDRDWMMCGGQKFLLRKGLGANVQITLRKRRVLLMMLAPLMKLRYMHFEG